MRQHSDVADVGAFEEVALEQALDDRVLHVGAVGPADQAMRVDRIGRAGDLVEGERNAFSGSRFQQRVMNGLNLFRAAELALDVNPPLDALLGRRRIKLKRAPADVELDLRAQGHRTLEAPLADVTPRTDSV